MIPGKFTSRMCNVLNVCSKYNAAHHNMPVTKKRRKVLCGEKKQMNKNVLKEGKSCEPGGFRWFL